MSIWRARRYQVQAAAGIVLALGVAVGAVGVAGPAQARSVLKLPPRSAAVSWGDNQDGQLGNGSTTSNATYAGVSGLSNGVAQVSAGSAGNSSLTPVPVLSLAGVTQISAGDDYSLAVHQVVLVFVPGGVPGTLRR
ncbi:MAG: hypothetical protein ACRDPF_20865 [Streptosporangiaceae bacterium]